MKYAQKEGYKPGTWRNYDFNELGWFVHLLAKRAQHRSDPEKKAKDLYDAGRYLEMMQAKLSEMSAHQREEEE